MATKTELRFETRNDLDADTRTKMVELLNNNLADLFDLYSQTKQAHWNVKGMNFIALHELFDELAAPVLDYADMVAERVTALGGYATGTARMAAENSRLTEFPTDIVDGHDVVVALADRWGQYAAYAREGIDIAEKADDIDTSDLFTEISRGVDKSLWFLEAHIQ